MANNANAGAAFGLEDVPDLPEAPTEQPKYNRDYHRLFVKFMSWLHKRTYTKALASNLNPTCRSSTLEQEQEGYILLHASKVPHGMEPPAINQVDPVNEVVKEVKKAETQHRGKKSCATRDLTETDIARWSMNSTAREL
ncbi:hypothetical protein SEMRO_1191_G250950.1 [Seminavis robusta]|uniref:Uncharacterized protein n=1 Tax=Seminavis robusta TaxID=568900 RepID=A0A9N8ELD0_9STRA|nr:hypothetical protein SEMRO_1191_G250950.1 [Seminavis robusta]|eukprot:Sro1191_g250950.1 n/a (139) ;mRNA; f:22746-23252